MGEILRFMATSLPVKKWELVSGVNIKKDPDCVCHEGTNIYNNTLVDNRYNIRNWSPDSRDSIKIMNNISLTTTGATAHAFKFSPAGVTWSHNLFDEAVTGNAAINSVIGDPALKKSSGWRSLLRKS